MTRLGFLDFFAGVGLAEIGLEDRWECLWANDIDPKKASTYRSNFNSSRFHLGDVSDVNAGLLPPAAVMAWASFPCQDLSVAGWQRGMSGRRSGVFWEFWRLMQELQDLGRRPKLIVIENVAGLLNESSFGGLCEALAALGMQFGALLIDADHFVPQSRPRVFVVAVDSFIDCRELEDSEAVSSPWFPGPLRNAYDGLPETLKPLWRWWKLPLPSLPRQNLDSVIEAEPSTVQWHSNSDTLRLLAMMTDRNRAKVEESLRIGSRQIGLLYRRTRQGIQRAEVRFDGLAGCLRTPSGGSSRQTVLIVDNATVRSRLLSPREAARLMGVPDSFSLPANYNDAYKAMGDGVVVPVVRWLSDHLLTPLAAKATGPVIRIRSDALVVSDDVGSLRMASEARAKEWALSRP
jgi:DNA (cytosine-5)-methyltransferase 1